MNSRESQLQAFDRLLTIMDELRDQCPWDKKQTLQTLRHLTIEETYELSDAIIQNDLTEVKKELGDILLHIVFYSKIASETATFDIGDVIESLIAKLIRRHPHVFEGLVVDDMEEVIENWEAIKAKEKGRTSSLDGIAMAQPALPLVEKLIYRAEKYKVELPMADVESASQQLQSAPSEETVGQALAAIIALAHQHGIDPESSLRGHARAMIEKIRQSEAG